MDERIALIDRVIDVYESHTDEFSELIAREVGIPVSNRAQVTGPADHMRVAREILREYPFESRLGSAIVRREPIGVCALSRRGTGRSRPASSRSSTRWPPGARSSPNRASTPPRAAP